MDQACYPRRGIVAGSTLATYEAKVFLSPCVHATAGNIGDSAGLSLHWGTSDHWVVNSLKEIATIVHERLTQTLKLPMAYHKFGLAASSGPLLRLAQQELGVLGGPDGHLGSVSNLGIDTLGGRRKSRPGANTVLWPEKSTFPDQPEAHHDVRRGGPRVGRDGGVTFREAQVDLAWGLSHFAGPVDIASLPIERLSKEWWMTSATHPTQHVHADVLKVNILVQVWESAVRSLQHSRGWNWFHRSKGPVSDTLLWLEKAQWKMSGPGILIDRLGAQLNLTEVSPAAI
eukprot:2022817-Pyramimonas_sp.AAC.1